MGCCSFSLGFLYLLQFSSNHEKVLTPKLTPEQKLTRKKASFFGLIRFCLARFDILVKKPASVELTGFFLFFNWCSSGDSNPGHPA